MTEQEIHFQNMLSDYQVAVFSPQTILAEFQGIFPEPFILLKSQFITIGKRLLCRRMFINHSQKS